MTRVGLNRRRLHHLFVTYARHGIGILVHIDAHVDHTATVGEALDHHVQFLLKGFVVRVLERIVSLFFPALAYLLRAHSA